MRNLTDFFDVLIVGCGVAGMSAAVSAAEKAEEIRKTGQISIAVLERADRAYRGGSSAWTGATMRMIDERTLAPHFYEDLRSYSNGQVDEKILRTLAEMTPPTIAWLKSKGINFSQVMEPPNPLRKYPRIIPEGHGRAVLEKLGSIAESLGVQFSYQTTARRLSVGDKGLIEGVWIRRRDGAAELVKSNAVILACGGFEGDEEMLTKYLGKGALTLRQMSKGGLYNRGEGIRMAMEIGAKERGQWDRFNAEPVDPRSKAPEAIVMAYPYGILVDKRGERFADEGESSYQKVSMQIFDLPEHVAYVVADQRLRSIPYLSDLVKTDQPPVESDDLEKIAQEFGIQSGKLTETVQRFNQSIRSEILFDPSKEDGRHTEAISPAKSNWAVAIDKPPYICYPVVCSIVFTFGGVATDINSRVLSSDDYPIPGLYAAGETSGFYYNEYVGSTSVLRGLVFGRIAGSQAAHYASGLENRRRRRHTDSQEGMP